MQRLAIICLLCFTYACSSKSEPQQTAKKEEWVLTEKKSYEYRLNVLGKPDTTFIYSYKYKDGNLYDSSKSFYVSRYKGGFLSDKIYFDIRNDKSISQHISVQYQFDKKGKILETSFYKGQELLKNERFSYNDSNLLVNYRLIQSKSLFQLPDESNSPLTPVSNKSSMGYDTVIGTYKYDNLKKVSGTSYTDTKGNIVRNDLNIYSGNNPLSTHSVDFKGDTIQKISYEIDGKILRSRLENDSFILYQNLLNGVQTGQLVTYKNRVEKWRNASSYDQKGRKVEDRVYKAM